MISKLIVWDVNRTEALRKLHRALESYEIVGLNNNIPFLLRCSSHAAFRDADLDTGFIPKHHDELFKEASLTPAVERQGQVLAAAVAALYRVNSATSSYDDSPFGTQNAGFRVNSGASDLAQTVVVLQNGEAEPVEVGVRVLTSDMFSLRLPDGSESVVSIEATGRGLFRANVDDNIIDFSAFYEANHVSLWCGPQRWTYDLPAPEWAQGASVALTAGSLVAPMPGRITKLLVKPGDEVKAGDIIIILEAMKMEHSIRAPEAGKVSAVNFAVGELCEGGAVLAIVE